jgi:hypothetical protein
MSNLQPPRDSQSTSAEPAVSGWRSDLWRLVALVPAVAAIGVAIPYGVGAVLWAAQVNGGGLAIGPVMSLVPLEQVLTRGVSTVAFAGAVALILAPIFAGISRVVPRLSPDEPEIDPTTTTGRVALLLIVLLVAGLLFVVVPPVFIGLVAVLLWLVVHLWKGGELDLPFRRLLAFVVAFVLVLVVAHTVFDPGPLPDVAVRLEKAPPLRGRLITSTGDQWYLVTDDSRVVGVTASRVVRARVDADPEELSSTFADLFGKELLPDRFRD